MGLCLSVAEALWKEKVFSADHRTLRRVDEEDQDVVMRCSGSDYRLLRDGASLDEVEELAVVAPRASGVLERAGGAADMAEEGADGRQVPAAEVQRDDTAASETELVTRRSMPRLLTC